MDKQRERGYVALSLRGVDYHNNLLHPAKRGSFCLYLVNCDNAVCGGL